MPDVNDLAALRGRLQDLVVYRSTHLRGDEKGEGQIFLERLFQAVGHAGVREAGAVLEDRVRVGAERTVSFADLMWKPRCLIEMKKAGTDLRRHYQQAFTYWIHAVPDRPRYVLLCNFDEFWIYDFDHQLDEPLERLRLEDVPQRWEALAFLLPAPLEPTFANDLVAVTRQSADQMAHVFRSLVHRGVDRGAAQRFLLQCVMAAFAEDIGLLPSHLFTHAIDSAQHGGSAYDLVFGMFREMNAPGITPAGRFAGTPYFNGGLFADVRAFDLTGDELSLLQDAVSTDWSAVRPEIFGTLFEQSMDADERHAFGAHFTSPVDIAKIVQPCIVAPWRNRLEEARGTNVAQLERLLAELSSLRVLDPSCGAGNFLYVAYREVKRIEHDINEAINDLRRSERRDEIRLSIISPHQFYGIDINGFAVELAKVTLLLAKKLAVDELDLANEQVLPLDNLDENLIVGDALSTPWPAAQVIIGNPPYLGRRKLTEERGAPYVAELDAAFPEVGGVADYVVYWFRLAQKHLPPGGRAGLVGTNTIRQGGSRVASLDYIVDNGGEIVDAVSTQPWSGDAAVSVSIVNWVKGSAPRPRNLWVGNGTLVLKLDDINSSLSPQVDLRRAKPIQANKVPKACFQGQTPGHEDFFVPADAVDSLSQDETPPSCLHPALGGKHLLHELDVVRWVIDIEETDLARANAHHHQAVSHLRGRVLGERQSKANDEATRNADVLIARPGAKVNLHHMGFLNHWWQLAYRRSHLLAGLRDLDRYLAVTRTSSDERMTVFEFVDAEIFPNDSIVAFLFADDYTFGVLQSSIHRLWFEERCTTLELRLNYTNTTVWDCFPWPQNPDKQRVQDVVSASVRIRGAARGASRGGSHPGKYV